jgi:hypothetical protein
MTYIAFIDESGDHGMGNIDPAYPWFALAAVVYREKDYIDDELASVGRTKLGFWPHEGAVFHAYEIKKRVGLFSILVDPTVEASFRAELCAMFRRSSGKIIAAVIHKGRHKDQYVTPLDPYFLTVQFVLERIHMMTGDGTKLVFESRGKAEDKIVGDWCAKICGGENHRHHTFKFEVSFAKKSANIVGLQIADLACQPTIAYVDNKETQRPDWLAVRTRFRADWLGKIEGRGLKSFP